MADDTGRVLVVDLGTTALKVGVVTWHGRVTGWEERQLVTDYGPGGSATQDPAQWWDLLVEAARAVLAGVPSGDVAAVAVTGQWGSTVPVDADGLPVGRCLMWMDTQGARHARGIVGGPVQGYRPDVLAGWVRRTGGVPSTSGADPVGHMLHLERDRPDVAAAARWYLEPVDHLTMRLTGRPAATPMSMTAAWLTDNRRPDVLAYDPVLVRRAGLPMAKLPPLVASLSVLGPVSGTAAAALGITRGARVVTGMPDLHAAAVGSGCLRDFEAHISIGTSAWVGCPLPAKKTDVLRQLAAVPGLGDGGYLLADNQDSAGRCLQWFRGAFAAPGEGLLPSYDDLVGAAASSAPGAGGVLFTPWLTGERCPVDDRAARAGFHNLSVATTRADLARAVLEGVAYNLRWLLAGAEHFTRRRLEPIRLVGGGARSDLWCRILADVCDRTIERTADPVLVGLRGGGLAAALALDRVRREEVRALVPVDRVFAPDPAVRATYDRMFAEFPRLHRVQRRMFARLNTTRSAEESPTRAPGRRVAAFVTPRRLIGRSRAGPARR